MSSLISAALAASPFAGVNIAGFDFGVDIKGVADLRNAVGPLTTLNGGDGAGQMAHFAKDDNLNLFRLPVSWQYLINSNTLTTSSNTTGKGASTAGTLDATNSNNYDQLVQACLATGAKCIIDIHNYVLFENKIIRQGGLTNDQFANLWSQIATKYKNETNVVFGIMNEPHDLDITTWSQSVQAAVTAIRTAGATTQLILLPGTDFTGAQTYIRNGSAENLSLVHNPDGSNTCLIFDVHKYLDSDGSGQSTECVMDHVQDTFIPLAKFLVENGRHAILSETGGGNSDSCIQDLCNILSFINNTDAYMGYAGWAAGSFATSYNLSMTPLGATGNFTDQPIVKRCVVGTRMGAGAASPGTAKR